MGIQGHRPHHLGDPDSTGHRLLQLPPDHRALYLGRRRLYTVATENLGTGRRPARRGSRADGRPDPHRAAVGISAGVEAVVSDQPWLLPHTLLLCLGDSQQYPGVIVNMRGKPKTPAQRSSCPPSCLVGTLLTLHRVGVHSMSGRLAAIPMPDGSASGRTDHQAHRLLASSSRAFSNGCAAMTCVEAVSNGVMAFREPRSKNAQRTLTVIIAILIVLLFGIAWLAQKYQIMAMELNNNPHYQSLLSLIVMADLRTRLVLSPDHVVWSSLRSASAPSTAFADFPCLTRAIAMRDYLPHVFILARAPTALLTWHLRAHRPHRCHPDHVPRHHRLTSSRSTPSEPFSRLPFPRPAW